MVVCSRGYLIASLLGLLVFPATAGADRPSLKTGHSLSALSVQDEADPKDTQSCQRMGQLQITYSTEKPGAPGIGVVVTDPRNRRIGYDPVISKTWQELPQAEAYVDCEENGEDLRNCQATIQICGPVSGLYKLQVVASEAVKYSLQISGKSAESRDRREVRATDSHAELMHVPIEKRSREALFMKYYREPGVDVELLREPSRVARNSSSY